MSHPVHPALVHFPIACWSLATAADLASLWLGKPAWQLAGLLMLFGALAAVAAMATGFIELMKVGDEHPATTDLNRHVLLALGASGFYSGSLLLRVHAMSMTAPSGVALALSLCGFVTLCAAGWFGGKLVYGHGLGVKQEWAQPAIPPATNKTERGNG